MQLTHDISLYGETWTKTLEKLLEYKIFTTHYQVFKICVAIGIFFDKQIELKKDSDFVKSVPRTVMANDLQTLKSYFESAILTSNVDELKPFDIDQKIRIAFDDEYDSPIKELDFLTKFANYGVTVINPWIYESDYSTVDNFNDKLKEFCSSTNSEVLSILNDL